MISRSSSPCGRASAAPAPAGSQTARPAALSRQGGPTMARRWWVRVAVTFTLALGVIAGPAQAADPTVLRVNVFPGVGNLAIFAGQAQGIFAKHGLKIELQFTPNTAYALLLRKILLLKGLQADRDYTVKPTGATFMRLGLMKEHKEYAATMLN